MRAIRRSLALVIARASVRAASAQGTARKEGSGCACGCGGSTYERTYDPASDRLKGTYYQAVAKRKFDVNFVRK